MKKIIKFLTLVLAISSFSIAFTQSSFAQIHSPDYEIVNRAIQNNDIETIGSLSEGIEILGSLENNISNNKISTANALGIMISNSHLNNFNDNAITSDNQEGIYVINSHDNLFSNQSIITINPFSSVGFYIKRGFFNATIINSVIESAGRDINIAVSDNKLSIVVDI